MSFSFYVPQILDLSKTSLPSISSLSSYSSKEITISALSALSEFGRSPKRKFETFDSQDTVINSFVDQKFMYKDDVSMTQTEEEEGKFFPTMSAAAAPLRVKGYYSFGKPLNNMYPATIRSMVSWGSLYNVVTGQQNFATIASMGHVSQVGVNSPSSTDYRFTWPVAYLNIQPDTETTYSYITNPTIPKTTSIGLGRVYHEIQFKNLQNIGVQMELMLVQATDNCAQEPITDLIDSATVYGQDQLTWTGPSAGEVVTGATNGRPTINHPGFRVSDA